MQKSQYFLFQTLFSRRIWQFSRGLLQCQGRGGRRFLGKAACSGKASCTASSWQSVLCEGTFMAQPCSAPRCYHKWEIKHFVSQQNTLPGLHPYPLNFICASCKSVSHSAAASFSAVSHFFCVCSTESEFVFRGERCLQPQLPIPAPFNSVTV